MAEQKKDKQEGPPPLPDDWTRCRAYMEKKHRYCRSDQVNKWGYCGNHKQFCPEADKKIRIPCPIDPSHTIYENQVEKHIKVCPKAVRMREQEDRPYFRRDVNCGGHGSQVGTESSPTSTDDRSLKWAQNIALKVLEIHQRLFGGDQMSTENLTLQDIHDAIPMRDLSKPEMEAGLADAVEHYRIRSGGPQHLHQQASLVGHLRSIKVLPPTPKEVSNKHDKIKFLEMGAGRGMLGLVAAGVASASGTSNVHLTLVERSGCRSKADTVLRKSAVWKNQTREYLQLHALGWSRVQCDLAHIHLPTVLTDNDSPTVGEKRKEPTGGKEQLVVVAKHLCGAGTDLALKSLRDVDVDACVMATCCHGVCNWNDYVARDFLMQEFGVSFGAADFELLRKWSSGTVASVFGAAADTEHQTAVDDGRDPYGVTAVSRSLNLKCGIQGLGRACQRLLDEGRCEYMRKVLFADGSHDVSLCQYVGAEVTPQNAVLMARRKTLSQVVV